jgi:alkyl sulfatase BDS1-like metallo-beta-lactamase superfamily hydrolase
LDSKKAEGLAFVMNLVTPDNKEKYVVELSNATLTAIEGFQHEKPDLTLTINRSDLETVMMGTKTLEELIANGTVKTQGDVSVIEKLKMALTQFEIGFEVLPGTVEKN